VGRARGHQSRLPHREAVGKHIPVQERIKVGSPIVPLPALSMQRRDRFDVMHGRLSEDHLLLHSYEYVATAITFELTKKLPCAYKLVSLLCVLDRRDKDTITLLFAAIPNYSSIKAKQKQKEIKDVCFQKSLPEKASPSAKYFWSARRSPVKKAPKVQVSTHQFPIQGVPRKIE
jgi:hypothetical protein